MDDNPTRHLIPGYYSTGELTDGILMCADREFRVHKAVLCAQSRFFTKAFNESWKGMKNSCATIVDSSPATIQAMLEFMYTSDYDGYHGLGEDGASPIVFHIRVYTLSCRYDIPDLRNLAQDKFRCVAEQQWNEDAFSTAIKEVYASAPPNDKALRAILFTIIDDHINELTDNDYFRKTMRSVPGCADDMMEFALKERL